MSVFALWRRYTSMSADDRAFYRRRFVDLKLHGRPGFAQFGEDASAMEYLRTIGKRRITYLDIGGNDPVIHSNTYLFYRDGSSGVVVDANPRICERQRRKRPRDTVVNCGIAAKSGGKLKLHVMDMDGLSTLSEGWSERLKAEGLARTVEQVDVSIVGINELLNDQFPSAAPDLASVDVEGLDYEVLDAWDFDRWRPLLLCAETGVLARGRYHKDARFAELMAGRRYHPLFETFSNTIFVDADRA